MKQSATHQRGATLLMAILIIALATMGVFLASLNPSIESLQRKTEAHGDLAIARDALLGYSVIAYADGRLPIPDLGLRSASHTEGTVPANPAGNSKTAILFGRLPWKSLGIGLLRDEGGECIWYAIGGAWKNDPALTYPLAASDPPLVNWDTLGEFELVGDNGAPLTGNLHLNRPIAVLFASGSPLPGQDRSNTAIVGEQVTECGGNYAVHNYLDPTTTTATLGNRGNAPQNGFGSTEMSADSRRAIAIYDHASIAYAPKAVFSGPVSAGDQPLINDRVLPITADDIFLRVRSTTTFRDSINGGVLDKLATCLTGKNVPTLTGHSALAGSPIRSGGKLPAGFSAECPGIATSSQKLLVESWLDNLWYVSCSGSACLTLSTGATCDGALIFAGARNATQRRSNITEKSDVAQYLEGTTLELLTTGTATALTNPDAYGSGSPETDIVRCLVRPSITGTVDVNVVDGLLVDAAPNIGGKTLVDRSVGQTITLGDPTITPDADVSQLVGCTWIGTPLPFGNGLRIYFRYTLVQRGDGFVFAVIDADKNTTGVCGAADPSGRYLGYAGRNLRTDGTQVTPAIDFPKIGIEFDTERNDYNVSSPCNDNNDSTSNHIAVMYWGYSHDAPAAYTDSNANTLTKRPFFDSKDCSNPLPDVDYLEDDNYHELPDSVQIGYQDPKADKRKQIANLSTSGRTFHVRIDIQRKYPDPSDRASVRTRVWINETTLLDGMNNLNQDFDSISTSLPALDDNVFIYDQIAGTESFQQARFGFTNAQSDGSSGQQLIDISGLAVKSR